MTSIKRAAGITLLGVYPHPDDEQGLGGAFARALRQGAKAYLLCMTRGEAGQISDPALATPETLGAVRTEELRRAVAVYDWEPPIVLDFPDGHLHEINEAELTDAIVTEIRRLRPQVLVTFDETGIYGHLDHIAVHHAATAAFTQAADPAYRPDLGPAHRVKKLYYSTMPRSAMQAAIAGAGDDADFGGDRRTIALEEMGTPDETITTVVKTPEFLPLFRESIQEHRTQFSPEALEEFESFGAGEFFATSWFIRVHPAPPPGATLPDEDDLLTGLIG